MSSAAGAARGLGLSCRSAAALTSRPTANPLTKKVEGKSTYVRKTPGGDGLVGVGIYR